MWLVALTRSVVRSGIVNANAIININSYMQTNIVSNSRQAFIRFLIKKKNCFASKLPSAIISKYLKIYFSLINNFIYMQFGSAKDS